MTYKATHRRETTGGGGGIPEAPIDGSPYSRQDAGWVASPGAGGGIPEAPNDGNAYVRAGLGWQIGYTKTAADALLADKADQADLADHEARVDNPHAVTAAQAGADPAGSAATVQGNLNTHEADQSNPHNVTAAQTGAPTQGDLDAHTGRTDNPHSVTAAQAGADPAGSAAAVQSNLDTHTGDSDIHFPDAPIDGKQYTRKDAAWEEIEVENKNFTPPVALSAPATDLATGLVETVHVGIPFKATSAMISVTTPATGSGIEVDIHKNGFTVFTTTITIDATENTSLTATTAYALTGGEVSFAQGDKIEYYIDAIGSTTAGQELKAWLIGEEV